MIEAEFSSTDSSSDDESSNEELEYQRSISDGFNEIGGSQKSTSRSIRLYCFACHRMEYHYNALKGTAYHHLLIGLTFGLAYLFGPFRCRCCGYRRLCRFNFLNLRYHFHKRKYTGKGNSGDRSKKSSSGSKRSRSNRATNSLENQLDSQDDNLEIILIDDEETVIEPKRRRRKKKKLRSVPHIDTIGKERREQVKLQQYAQSTQDAGLDFSIDGIVGSFETEESRKERLAQIEEERANRGPFVAKTARTRKKSGGKPKRRHARKERLAGPTVFCFSCKQKNEHFHVLKGTTYYAFLFGITFGISALIGPFRCSVCGKKRMSGTDVLNPRYMLRNYLDNSGGGYG